MGAVLIDMQRYKGAGMQAHLLEPGRTDLLPVFSKFMPDLQITIFTQTRPWLALAGSACPQCIDRTAWLTATFRQAVKSRHWIDGGDRDANYL